jgi:predicted metal-dependent enzyme (double-stranded beta helix superfamily)
MFDLQRFIEDCRAVQRQGDNQSAIRELLARAVSDPGTVLTAIGPPTHAGVTRLYHGKDVTILNIVWGPYMTLMPHNHQMWGVIGIYTGREDNVFWRRIAGEPDGRVEAAGAKAISVKDCVPLGRDIIHSVTNPIPRLTGAIQIYGGDFFNEPRSEWDPEHLHELPYNVEKNMRLFEESNTRLAAS